MTTDTLEHPGALLEKSETCCPEFDPSLWDYAQHDWSNKLFLKDSIPELFHIPLPGTYKRSITRMWKQAQEAGADPEPEDFMIMAHDPSPFKSELFMPVTKEIPGANTVRLDGTYISRVFEGSYQKVPQCIKDTDGYLASLGKTASKFYFYFPYCPNCAKKFGHNYIVAIAEVSPLSTHSKRQVHSKF